MTPADRDRAWRGLVVDTVTSLQVASLWGKSPERGGGTTNLLLQHLLDAMAVGELCWDRFIAPALRRRLDGVAAGGDGRRLYAWLCALHDIGKASPAFQRLQPSLAAAVSAAGLPCPPKPSANWPRWRHERAGALMLRELLRDPWALDESLEARAWVWPLIAGHHGIFPDSGQVSLAAQDYERRRDLHGDGPWVAVHRLVLEIVTAAAGWPDLAGARPIGTPARADQLAWSGFITMADWIASDSCHFPGIDRFEDVGVAVARARTERAWHALDLRGGWGALAAPGRTQFAIRFGRAPRPAQSMVVDAARALPAPGLLVVEAPMGEGKTEAALGAAEVLAARFGCDGVYVALPTQATSDAMFDRVRDWAASFVPPPQVALLHGRSRLTDRSGRTMAGAVERPAEVQHDEFGCPEELFASICEELPRHDEAAGHPAEWFYGRRRGLLAANGVGTIDQALYAGTRTKYVALRYAGLAGKVVVFDEVHAADTYMTQFLGEVLWWLGNGSVPVVLLSATLAPQQRDELVERYLQGASRAGRGSVTTPSVAADGYPSVTSAWVGSDGPAVARKSGPAWRPSLAMEVSIREEEHGDVAAPVGAALQELLAEGGCALVIRNTVDRAQETYRALEPVFGPDVVLLHSRFTADARARTTRLLLDRLGRDEDRRPHRLVVVATQVAEQSFDIDADLLVTDLSPVDLVLQRAGRVHRHERMSARPALLRKPRLVVTGVGFRAGEAPWFPRGSEIVYGRHHLIRSAALARLAAGGGGWSVPADVPALVAAAYGSEVELPDGWARAAAAAERVHDGQERDRRRRAVPFLLVKRGEHAASTLAGLHTDDDQTDEAERVVQVRDGEMGVEVMAVVEDDHGWRTVDGRPLGPNGGLGRGRPEVLGSLVRLPTYDPALAGAARELRPLPDWKGDPWLGTVGALRLDRTGSVVIGGRRLSYDGALGLVIERAP